MNSNKHHFKRIKIKIKSATRNQKLNKSQRTLLRDDIHRENETNENLTPLTKINVTVTFL